MMSGCRLILAFCQFLAFTDRLVKEINKRRAAKLLGLKDMGEYLSLKTELGLKNFLEPRKVFLHKVRKKGMSKQNLHKYLFPTMYDVNSQITGQAKNKTLESSKVAVSKPQTGKALTSKNS